VHNGRVPLTPRATLRLAALTTAAALGLSGCSSGGEPSTPTAGSPSPASRSTNPAVPVPSGVELTAPGTRLAYGDPATVAFGTTRARGTVLRLVVRGVQRGRLSDFGGFILDSAYKRTAAYYYATVSVRNIGDRDLEGAAVPLRGVDAADTLLPAVRFTTRFARCPSVPLPARFPPGASFDTCLVYLSPNRSALSAISYRPTQQFNPITWTGRVAAPSAQQAPKPAQRTKKR
jgi:hypothetical protein